MTQGNQHAGGDDEKPLWFHAERPLRARSLTNEIEL